MPRAKADAPAQSRWRLDEAVRGETAIDSSGRTEFEFAAGEVSVDVDSDDETVLARVLTQTAHAVPVDDNAHKVALAPPPSAPIEPPSEEPQPIEPPSQEEPAPSEES